MKNREEMLRNEKIGPLLVKLSLPATIGMMVNALYNVVDTIFVGKGVDALAIGGLTVAFPIQMVVMALAMLIGIGAQANISIAFGAGEMDKANRFAGNAYTMAFAVALIFTAGGLFFIEPLLRLFGASTVLMPYAKDYMSIIFTGSIIFSLTMVNNNILRSEGNAKISMVIMIIGTGLNIVLDPIFIFAFKMGIRGAALATVVSQYTAFTFALVYFFKGSGAIKPKFAAFKLKMDYVRNILKLGFPSFVRQVMGSVLAIFLNNSIVFLGGDIALSAFGVINRIMMFIFLPMFGVVQGIQPIIGFNYGAKSSDRVKQTVAIGIKFLVSYCVAALLIILVLNVPLLKLFTNDVEAIRIGTFAIKIMFMCIPLVGLQITAAAFFQSIGKARPALFLSLLRQVILLLPLIIIMPKLFNLGLTGIWLAFPLADLVSSLISAFVLKNAVSALELPAQ